MKSEIRTGIKAVDDDSTFEMPRSANDVIAEALRQKVRPPLFDAFWQGGEVALLFGEAGAGKSVLATQIAEALARGKPLDGFVMPRRRHRVLYVDLNLSAVQFQRRYTPENENGGKPSPYRFAERFHRGCPPHGKDLVSWITKAVALCSYEVIVIDDLSAVMRTDDGTFDSLRIMREMKRLSQRTGVSILVLADSMPNRRGLETTEADLRRSRVLCSVADSVFGLSCLSDGLVKLIQFRVQTAKIVWDSKNAVECTIFQQDNGFLGMYFDPRFRPKIDPDLCYKINFATLLHSNGFSYSQIAQVMSISRSKAFRLVRQWTPLIQEEVERLDRLRSKDTPEADKPHGNVRTGSDGCSQHWHDVFARTDWVSDGNEIDEETDADYNYDPDPEDDDDDDETIDITPENSYFEDAEGNSDLPWYQRLDPTQLPFAAGVGRRSIYDLEREFDEYDNELFVESRSPDDRRRTVWYSVCKRSGRTRRHHRTYHGTRSETISNDHWLPRRE